MNQATIDAIQRTVRNAAEVEARAMQAIGDAFLNAEAKAQEVLTRAFGPRRT